MYYVNIAKITEIVRHSVILYVRSLYEDLFFVGCNRNKNSQTTGLSTSSSYTGNTNKLFTDILNLHNKYRSKHGSMPLTLNNKVRNVIFERILYRKYIVNIVF